MSPYGPESPQYEFAAFLTTFFSINNDFLMNHSRRHAIIFYLSSYLSLEKHLVEQFLDLKEWTEKQVVDKRIDALDVIEILMDMTQLAEFADDIGIYLLDWLQQLEER